MVVVVLQLKQLQVVVQVVVVLQGNNQVQVPVVRDLLVVLEQEVIPLVAEEDK